MGFGGVNLKLNLGKISRFILFGGGNQLFHTARQLKNSGKEVYVCSAPRHLQEVPPTLQKPLALCLTELGIPVLEAEDVNESPVLDWINRESLGFGFGPAWVFGPRICDAFGERFINLMGIRMPHYLGGAHYTWQILSENRLGACNFQLIEKTVNTGPLLFTQEYFFENCTIPLDFFRVAEREEMKAIQLLLGKIERQEPFELRSLDKALETYYPALNSEKQGWIDWSWSARQISLFINAFGKPYRGASTQLDGQRLFLHRAHLELEESHFHPFQNGMVFRKTENGISIAAPNGTVIVQEFLDEQGSTVSYEQIKKGMRFYTPQSQLEEARLYHASYSGKGLKK